MSATAPRLTSLGEELTLDPAGPDAGAIAPLVNADDRFPGAHADEDLLVGGDLLAEPDLYSEENDDSSQENQGLLLDGSEEEHGLSLDENIAAELDDSAPLDLFDDEDLPRPETEAGVAGSKPRIEKAPVLRNPPTKEVEQPTASLDEDVSPWRHWLQSVWSRTREVYRELCVVAGICLIGIVVYVPPYNRFAGGVLMCMSLTATLFLLLAGPMRIECRTPAHAVHAYFQALGHYLPDYRRMYSLLTEDARAKPAFVSYSGFRGYWRYQLSRIKPVAFGLWPVDCRLELLDVERSPAVNQAVVEYTLHVHLRGHQSQPLKSYRMSTRVIRGPGEMWYLDDGSLPDPQAGD